LGKRVPELAWRRLSIALEKKAMDVRELVRLFGGERAMIFYIGWIVGVAEEFGGHGIVERWIDRLLQRQNAGPSLRSG
jgi:hypothetical protein